MTDRKEVIEIIQEKYINTQRVLDLIKGSSSNFSKGELATLNRFFDKLADSDSYARRVHLDLYNIKNDESISNNWGELISKGQPIDFKFGELTLKLIKGDINWGIFYDDVEIIDDLGDGVALNCLRDINSIAQILHFRNRR